MHQSPTTERVHRAFQVTGNGRFEIHVAALEHRRDDEGIRRQCAQIVVGELSQTGHSGNRRVHVTVLIPQRLRGHARNSAVSHCGDRDR